MFCHIASSIGSIIFILRYFIDYLCFVIYMYLCNSIWSFIFILTLLYLLCVLSYTCISVILFVYVFMYSLLNILWILDLNKYYYDYLP